MIEFWKNLFTVAPFIPHGHCYLWKPGLVGLHIVSDLLIALAYYSIPITLLYFVRKRQDLPYRWIFLLFSAFIVACGTTHLMEIWTLWYPTYWLSGGLKAITAFVSVLTAIELVPLVPQALALPSPAQLEAVNRELEQENRERERVEEELRRKETLLRSMTDASPFAFYVVDNRTDAILYFNHRFCKIWGIEHLEEQMQRGQLKNNNIIPDCLPVLADVPAFAESYKPLQSEENRAVVEDEIPFGDGRTIRRFSTQIRDEGDRYFGRLYLFEDITERKQVEEQLQLADFSLERSSLGLAWIDRNARILRVNQTACEQRGYSREELLSMHVWDTDPNFPIEAWPQHWQELKEQKTLSFTSQHFRKDGSVLPVEITLNYLEFNGKEYSFACARDISDRKQAEAALRESEARFQAFMDCSPAAAWITDRDGRLLYFSQTFSRIFNLPIELIGKLDVSIYPPELSQEYLKNIHKVLETNQTIEAIELAPLADGSLGEFLVYKFPLPSSSGTVLVGGVAIDITERKKAEAVLQQREQEFRALVENAPDIIMRLDRECRYLYINPTVERQSGIPPAIFIDKTINELGAPEELVNLWGTAIEQVFETGCEQNIEYEIPAVAGLTYYASRVVPEFGSDGSVQSVLAIARDISERKVAEAALKQARDELEIRVKERTAQLAKANKELGQEISEREQTQAALQASETRLKELLDNTAAFIFSARIHPNKAWEYDYYSPNGEEILSYKGEEFAADPSLWFSRIPAEDIERIVQPAMEDLYAGQQITLEYRFRHKNGSLHWLSNTLLAKKHKSEDYWFATGIVIDITERKQAEKALQESEQRFAALAETAPVGIFRTDPQGNCVYANERSFETIGLSVEESIGAGWATGIHPDDRDRTIAAWLSFVQQGIPYDCEYRFQRPGGSVIWVLGQAIAEKDVDGNIIGYIGTITDITERKQSEQLLKDYNQLLEAQVQERTAALSRMNACLEQEIEERKRSQAALKESEARYRAILEDQTELIARSLPDGTLTFVNEAFCRFYGKTREELVGHRYEPIVFEEDREHVARLVKTLSVDNPLVIIENRVIAKGQEVRWTQWVNRGIFDENGQFLEFQGVGRDITERKLAEENLRRYEKIVAATTDAICLVDRNYTYQIVNQAYLTWHHRSQEEILGHTISEVLGIDLFETQIKTKLDQCLRGEIVQYELWAKYPSAEEKFISATYAPYLEVDGTILGVVVSLRNLTELKQMEAALQQSNERFQLAASAVKGFIYDWDLKQNTVLRTQGLFDAVGYHPEEAAAKFDWWHEHIHPEDLPSISQQLAEAFSNPTQNYYVIEYRLRHRDGHYVYLSDYGTIARDADGRASRAVGHAIDVSDRRKAEAALQKALQAAQAASIAKSRFLSNMSHELRTPLNAILGFSQVMVRSSSLSSEHKEQLKIINRSGEHLLNLINDILSMSKIEAGQVALNENRFDLYQLLEDLEQMFKLKAISKSLHLTFERASDIPQYVQTDENKLRQILINILENAIKFTASGYVILRVKKGRASEVACPQNINSKTYLLFEIEDTGPGIASDEIKTLFDPFVQTETGRQSMQGTGLGLPISRQFVQMMGGDIAVTSQLDKGTIFTFDILAIEVAKADEKSLSTTQQVIGLEPNQPAYRILVVEDVEENRQLLLKMLEPLGFQVREAVNGQEAIALWSAWKPHLIWMDMRMPVMDGYEATREIKTLEQQSAVARENNNSPADSSPTNTTKIIALTASAFDEDRAKIMAAGCDDFIHKPFRESILFDKMAQHLGVRYICQEDLPLSLLQSATPRKLTPEDLNVLPSEWIAQFKQRVLYADDELILQLIKQIPESEASLAQTLADLVNNFRLDILFDLTQGLTNE